MNPSPIMLAGCIIQDKDNRIFLLHRNKNGKVQWEIPGGKVDSDELPQDAAIRELLEETGKDIRITNLFKTAEFTEKGKACSYSWFYAEFKNPNQPIVLESGFDSFDYFSITDLKTMHSRLSQGTKKLLELI